MTRLLHAVLSAVALVFIAAACGPSAQWVSVPLLTCPGKEWNDIKRSVDLQKMLGPARCGKAGKSYAGDWRCESGVVEVKCK
ncbi:MAG: hypothetical protein Q8K96_06915 [Rubrivivax sp.]|nr:hypothetical protein [Rubrivivax sp.]